jgi:hypothetical protein
MSIIVSPGGEAQSGLNALAGSVMVVSDVHHYDSSNGAPVDAPVVSAWSGRITRLEYEPPAAFEIKRELACALAT